MSHDRAVYMFKLFHMLLTLFFYFFYICFENFTIRFRYIYIEIMHKLEKRCYIMLIFLKKKGNQIIF